MNEWRKEGKKIEKNDENAWLIIWQFPIESNVGRSIFSCHSTTFPLNFYI